MWRMNVKAVRLNEVMTWHNDMTWWHRGGGRGGGDGMRLDSDQYGSGNRIGIGAGWQCSRLDEMDEMDEDRDERGGGRGGERVYRTNRWNIIGKRWNGVINWKGNVKKIHGNGGGNGGLGENICVFLDGVGPQGRGETRTSYICNIFLWHKPYK